MSGAGEVEYEVDIDEEKVLFEGEWYSRQTLADRIKRMIDNRDFRISGAGNALEKLQFAVANARECVVRLAPGDSQRLDRYAARAGVSAPVFIRQALLAYLAAQPPLDDGPAADKSVMTTITTEPVKPGEEASAVELTAKKDLEPSPVVASSYSSKDEPRKTEEGLGDSWFKKG
ncbi:MAG: hypothetical protein JXR96_29465 [Deltaproteobacteria bacterium]|nr:hypothetical protein [Deltaproteobacteria bacterium]